MKKLVNHVIQFHGAKTINYVSGPLGNPEGKDLEMTGFDAKNSSFCMLKNGYLSNKDISGSAGFVDATGTINVGTVINLKKVDFGGFELTNVRASVVENQVAPLLSRLGKIEIDNARQVIKITHRK